MSFVSKLFPLCSVDYPEKLIQERPLNVLKRYFSMLSSPQNKFGSALLFWNRGRNITKRYLWTKKTKEYHYSQYFKWEYLLFFYWVKLHFKSVSTKGLKLLLNLNYLNCLHLIISVFPAYFIFTKAEYLEHWHYSKPCVSKRYKHTDQKVTFIIYSKLK